MKRVPAGLVVFLLTLAALALRVAAAARMDYWIDDVGTIAQARRIDSLAEALVATRDWHPPLSFLFTKAWLALAGLTGAPGEELALRAPFLVLGALAVPLAFLVARRLLDASKEGPLAVALLVAANPLLVWSDRDIRGYALLVPLALAAVLFWLRAREGGRLRDWAAFSVLAALACWDHYNAIPFMAALLALGFLEGERRRSVIAGAAILALFSAWLPAMRDHLFGIDFARHEDNVQLAIRPVPVTAPAYVIFGLVLGYTVFPWNVAVVAPAALSSAWLALRGFEWRSVAARRAALVGLALPLLGAAATPFRMPRYHVASVPFLAILLVRGAGRARRGRSLLAIVLAATLFADVELLRGREHHFLFPLHPWRAAAALVRARPAPVVAPIGPFRFSYVEDLATPLGVAPVGSACWLLVDEGTTADEEGRQRSELARSGFRVTEDRTLLVDPDNDARVRWVPRTLKPRKECVRLLRLEK